MEGFYKYNLVNANIIGGAHFSPFQYNANVVCPITEKV
jgi:hypothetical protein